MREGKYSSWGIRFGSTLIVLHVMGRTKDDCFYLIESTHLSPLVRPLSQVPVPQVLAGQSQEDA
jgi:hypothetical protein